MVLINSNQMLVQMLFIFTHLLYTYRIGCIVTEDEPNV